MKLVTETQAFASTFEAKESSEFQIRGGAKAFQILLSDLYTDKIKAVIREVCTNAVDGHIAGGCADIPFDVHLPTHGHPHFVVRDYGIGMDHETVMHLYTTLFASMKDQSDDYVGALGLGSKSPFAYTDSFDVVARDGKEARIYQVYMDAAKIPKMDHVDTIPDPTGRGIEVSVPVQVKDFDTFRSRARDVFLGFAPVPNVDADLKLAQPTYFYEAANDTELSYGVFSGENVLGNDRVYIRQGCVIYPVADRNVTRGLESIMAWGSKIVVDVPIGTAMIAPNREALSLDELTIANLQAVFEGLADQIADRVYASCDAECSTMLEAQEWWLGDDARQNKGTAFNFDAKWKGQSVVNWIKLNALLPKDADGEPTYIKVKQGKSRKPDFLKQIAFTDRTTIKFAYHPVGEKIKRATMRYREWVDQVGGAARWGGTTVFHLGEIDPNVLADLKTTIGAADDQFVSLAKLPDPGPPQRGSRVTGNIAGAYFVTDSQSFTGIAKGDEPAKGECYWLTTERTNANTVAELWSVYASAVNLGIVESRDFVTMTPTAATRLNLDQADSLRDAIKKGAAAKEADFIRQYSEYLYNQSMNDGAGNFRYGVYDGKLLDALVKEFTVTRPPNTYLRYMNEAARDKATQLCATMVAEIKNKYPLLFGEVDDTAIQWYISTRDKELLTQQKGTELP